MRITASSKQPKPTGSVGGDHRRHSRKFSQIGLRQAPKLPSRTPVSTWRIASTTHQPDQLQLPLVRASSRALRACRNRSAASCPRLPSTTPRLIVRFWGRGL